ncbi:terminase large subunit [Pectobacterium phage MA13]|uniref:Terminase large subunit n=1 Tax=Pectobacterium phage MA13 TaxID=2662284 RepID=A0A5Q2F242_9CAUD|nr:terminase large subunit [Pectobacterium phage MA13]
MKYGTRVRMNPKHTDAVKRGLSGTVVHRPDELSPDLTPVRWDDGTVTNHYTFRLVEDWVSSATVKPKSKYDRDMKGVTVDVYDVLKAFGVTCPALQHAAKKVLCAGLRGHKDTAKDIREAIEALERAEQLHAE